MTTATRTLPDHADCKRHKEYRLSCQQFEALIARSGSRCEICAGPGDAGPLGVLCIDHNGPRWAVRGLLCSPCNIRLRVDNLSFPGAAEYVARSWWKQQCAAIGVPAGRRPEPPIGSGVRNQTGTTWVRISDWWHAPYQATPMNTAAWGRIFWSYGPHNLVPFDVRAAFGDGSLDWHVRCALERSPQWTDARAALGIPEPTAEIAAT